MQSQPFSRVPPAWFLFAPLVLASKPAFAAAPLNYLTSSGARADATLPLTWGVTIVSLLVTAIITALVAGAVWRKSGTKPQALGAKLGVDNSKSGTRWLWVGSGLSTLVLFASVIWTVAVTAQIASPKKKPAFTIEVTGRQWWWQVRYSGADPSRDFSTANEIHLPVGEPVHLRLIGGDVIHSFWVPQLSGKTDTIPGQTNESWIEARKVGVYRGQCTEYCGIEHAHMSLVVIAQSPADFARWWANQLQTPPAVSGAAAKGRDDFTAHCGGCHAVLGTDAEGNQGPDLSHLMQRTTIGAGTLANTAANLVNWISDPQIAKPGNAMPKPELSGDELGDIHAYLATLD